MNDEVREAASDDDAMNAAVDSYKQRSALFYEVMTLGDPTEGQARMLRLAHGFLGRAMEAELFDPEPSRQK